MDDKELDKILKMPPPAFCQELDELIARMNINYYILDVNGNPKKCTFTQWVLWSHDDPEKTYDEKVRIARYEKPGILVSTVFLGTDISHNDNKPLCFETLIEDEFLGEGGVYKRASTKKEALKYHAEGVDMVTNKYRDKDR